MDKTITKKKITRGLSAAFIKAFVADELFALYEENRNDLFLGIRNEYINIYYNGANVCKVNYNEKKNSLSCTTAKKYLYGEGEYGKNAYKTVTPEDIRRKFGVIKKNIEAIHSPLERAVQQQLVIKNNANDRSKWFCVDIEYVRQRNNRGEKAYGRFDIIAISKDKPHKVALIELKYGNKAIGPSSGVLKHSQDYIAFIENGEYAKHLRKEIIDIIKSLRELKTCPIGVSNASDLADTPDFYFITLGNERDEPRNTMRRYVLSDVDGASKYNVQKVCGINITEPNKKNFTPKFLFSDNNICNIGITDIIDSDLYSRGL